MPSFGDIKSGKSSPCRIDDMNIERSMNAGVRSQYPVFFGKNSGAFSVDECGA